MVKLHGLVAGRVTARSLMQTPLKLGGKLHLPEFFQRNTSLIDRTKRVIHTVDAGAGHHAQDEFGFHATVASQKRSCRNSAQPSDLSIMKALCVHAHFDDYEFVAAGTFEMWRRKLGRKFTGRVVVCTDGSAGHHFRTREETARIRLKEQAASARVGRYQFELLRLPNGQPPREACLQLSVELLAALWKSIRDFEPDYLFCPPLPADPLAGIHNDHVTVAEAVRRVAYIINVPHAFTPEYPADETRSRPCKVPVILNVYDGYLFGSTGFDLAIDAE